MAAGGVPDPNQEMNDFVTGFKANLIQITPNILTDFATSPMHNATVYTGRTFKRMFDDVRGEATEFYFSHNQDANRWTRRIYDIRLSRIDGPGHAEVMHITPDHPVVFERLFPDVGNHERPVGTNSRFFGKLDAEIGIFIAVVLLCEDIGDTRERHLRRRQQQQNLLTEARNQLTQLPLDNVQIDTTLANKRKLLASATSAGRKLALKKDIRELESQKLENARKILRLPREIENRRRDANENFNYEGLAELGSIFVGYGYCRSLDDIPIRLSCSGVRLFIKENFRNGAPFIMTAYPDSELTDGVRLFNAETIVEKSNDPLRYPGYEDAVLMSIPGSYENDTLWERYYGWRANPAIAAEWKTFEQAFRSRERMTEKAPALPKDAPRVADESKQIEELKMNSSTANFEVDRLQTAYNQLCNPSAKDKDDLEKAKALAETHHDKLQDARERFVQGVRMTIRVMLGMAPPDRQKLNELRDTVVRQCQCVIGGAVQWNTQPDPNAIIHGPVTNQATKDREKNTVRDDYQPASSYTHHVMNQDEAQKLLYSRNATTTEQKAEESSPGPSTKNTTPEE